MRSTSNLTEGMWAGDLNDLMRSVISVDEYVSKVDDDAIVIGYYVHDSDAANDLNRFIQKSAIDILDTEVSPAPDQNGYYIVFVELLRNDALAKTVFDLTNEIDSLTNINRWKASVFGVAGDTPMEIDALKSALVTAKKATEKQQHHEEVKKVKDVKSKIISLKKKINDAVGMMNKSSAAKVHESFGQIVIDDGRHHRTYEMVAFGPNALSEARLDNASLSVKPDDLRSCNSLALGLGDGWEVMRLGECLALHCDGSNDFLILREVE